MVGTTVGNRFLSGFKTERPGQGAANGATARHDGVAAAPRLGLSLKNTNLLPTAAPWHWTHPFGSQTVNGYIDRHLL